MTLGVDGFEKRLEAYGIERSEEARAVRVGEKEISEQAAIVARYADLFTREQLAALHEAEDDASDGARESIARLRLTCQEGIVDRELAEREDELENALLAARVPWDDGELSLRSAQAQLAIEAEYARRDRLGQAVLEVSSSFNDERRSLLGARHELEADVTGILDPVARSEREKGVQLRPILDAVDRARVESTPAFAPSASGGSTGCSGTTARPRRQAFTWRGSAGFRRSRRRIRRSEASPSASRRSDRSASTSKPSRASAPTSRIARRSRPAPA